LFPSDLILKLSNIMTLRFIKKMKRSSLRSNFMPYKVFLPVDLSCQTFDLDIPLFYPVAVAGSVNVAVGRPDAAVGVGSNQEQIIKGLY
jgi:hypothetical protein